MKRNSILLILLTIVLNGYSQNPLPTETQITTFSNSKTLVLLDGSMFSAYNIEIKEAMEKYWTITPFEFIESSEFEEKMKDSSYSFIMTTDSRFERDKSSRRYTFLNLLLGSDVETLSELPEFGHVPLTYTDDEDEVYVYKLKYLVKFLQNRANEIKSGDPVNAMKYLNYYNKNAAEVKDHVLHIAEHDLSANLRSESDIKEDYSHEIKILSHDELEETLSGTDEVLLFTHKVGPQSENAEGWAFKMVFDTNGKLYYYNKHNIKPRKPNGFTSSDFKRLGRYK